MYKRMNVRREEYNWNDVVAIAQKQAPVLILWLPSRRLAVDGALAATLLLSVVSHGRTRYRLGALPPSLENFPPTDRRQKREGLLFDSVVWWPAVVDKLIDLGSVQL